MGRLLRTFGCGWLAAVAACGGSSPSGPAPSPGNPFTITISSNGAVSPAELVVPQGTRVLFVNNDARRHDMTSDEHPDHLECPALNDVGLLQPGERRQSGNLVIVRTCGFHDHENPTDARLTGRVVIR